MIPESFVSRTMHEPDCGLLETKVYLWFCYRVHTQARRKFEVSLGNVASDFGLLVKTGARKGKPDSPRMARVLKRLQGLGLIDRTRRKTRREGNQPTRIEVLAKVTEPLRAHKGSEKTNFSALPMVVAKTVK